MVLSPAPQCENAGKEGGRCVTCVLPLMQTEDTTTSLRREFNQKAWKAIGGKYAQRVFGYLLPSVTGTATLSLLWHCYIHCYNVLGVYFFRVSLSETSAHASVEFWLSPTSNPMQSVLLGYTAVASKVIDVCVCVCVHVRVCVCVWSSRVLLLMCRNTMMLSVMEPCESPSLLPPVSPHCWPPSPPAFSHVMSTILSSWSKPTMADQLLK